MMRAKPLGSLALLFLSSALLASAQTYIWTGIGNGWRDQNAPTGTGTENLYYGVSLNNTPTLTPGSYTINSITITDGDGRYTLDSSGFLSLRVNTSIVSTAIEDQVFIFGSNLDIDLASAPTIDAGTSSLAFSGQLTGTPTTLTLRGITDFGVINFNGASGNTYTGNTVVGDASNTPVVSIWNSAPFGTGAVSFVQDGDLVFHDALTIGNALTLNSGGTAGTISMRTTNGVTTLSGNITLAANTTLAATTLTGKALYFANREGVLVMPGTPARDPLVITGNIGEAGGARSLSLGSSGITILAPTIANTYTGGTTVTGSVIFANNNALPATGVIQVGIANTSPTPGYAGTADLTAGNFANFLGKLSATSSGAVGVDTLPGNSTVTFSENISLTRFTGASSSDGIRLGTATSAILTGTITPQTANYHFGNGGGTLYVQSALPNVSTVSHLVMDNNNAEPLRLFLQGNSGYTGNTYANNGYIIFDGTALPTGGFYRAGGSSTTIGSSYIGRTDCIVNPSAYFSSFDKTNTWGIVGFDTHPGNSTATFSGLDLTGFNDGVYLGTTTSAIFTGTITPSSVGNANNAANTLRFTAAKGGSLTIDSQLADINANTPLSVVVGSTVANQSYSTGTVTLTQANTYTGDTTLASRGTLLGLGNSSALGTGTLHVLGGGLMATTSGVTLSNPISLENQPTLYLMGATSFSLGGLIAGNGSIYLQRDLSDPLGAATLAGDNSDFTGTIGVQHGTLTLTHDRAAGGGTVALFDSTATVQFAGGATAPVIHGISGDTGKINVPNGVTLTFDTTDDTLDQRFGGVIGNNGTTSANVVVTSSTDASLLYLHGANQYYGGTAVNQGAILALGNNAAAGSGTITLNATGNGGLYLNSGVTLTNALAFNSGTLGGFGTFDPTNLSTVSFGFNQAVRPGLPNQGPASTGKLSFDPNVSFATGGTYYWALQNPASSEGANTISILGNLDLTSISTAGFTFVLQTFDADGSVAPISLVAGNNYQFTLATTGGTVNGFDPNDFTFDVADFQNGTYAAAAFSLTADATHLYLNFQAVPEPPVYVLAGIGAAALLAWRRRLRRTRC